MQWMDKPTEHGMYQAQKKDGTFVAVVHTGCKPAVFFTRFFGPIPAPPEPKPLMDWTFCDVIDGYWAKPKCSVSMLRVWADGTDKWSVDFGEGKWTHRGSLFSAQISAEYYLRSLILDDLDTLGGE